MTDPATPATVRPMNSLRSWMDFAIAPPLRAKSRGVICRPHHGPELGAAYRMGQDQVEGSLRCRILDWLMTGKTAAGREHLPISDLGHQRGSDDRTNARDFLQPSAFFTRACQAWIRFSRWPRSLT